MTFEERPVVFDCQGERLVGIVTVPREASGVGVVIVVGGSQYRVGSHRQFLLLARMLARAGIAVMRFDHRGMGDSSGELPPFDALTPDIRAAIGALQRACPAVSRVGLWGMCDAASAILIYAGAARDARVAGLALLNPWVRSEVSLARTHLRHYYVRRVFDRAFWQRLLRGGVDVGAALRGLADRVRTARTATGESADGAGDFQTRMRDALRRCALPVLVVLSENDITAREFVECTRGDAHWQAALARANVDRMEIDADHTFSSAAWRAQVEQRTLRWVQAMAASERQGVTA